MRFSQLVFNNSPWWIVLALLAGLIYAFILYSKKGPWGPGLEKVLFAIRTIVVTILILLLINPLIKTIENTTVPPKAVVIVDNSQSLTESLNQSQLNDGLNNIKQLTSQLSDKGFDVVVRDLNSEIELDSIRFNNQSTDISKVLKTIETTYDEGDLSLCLLLSDGIYNLGSSPDYHNFSFPIYTMGIGDTIPKKDIILKNVRYNKVVTKGNKFPVTVDVVHNGFEKTPITVNLALNGDNIDSKTVRFDSNLNIETLEFLVDVEASGLNRFQISTPVLPNEQVSSNNRKDIYVDIIDNKDKILLIGSAPHPDIKALKQAIEKSKNFEFVNYIPGVTKIDEEDFGVAIAHQPFSNNRQTDQFIQKLIEAKTPIWYILGSRTNLNTFNRTNNVLDVQQVRGQSDKVSAVLNESFSKFKLADAEADELDDFPPIRVPYGNYQFKTPNEVLLTQRIGSIESLKPLLVVSNELETKEAVLLGTGIWQWRIQEIVKSEDSKSFDTWVSKLIQYLNTKEDRKKFRFYTSSDEYTDSESVVFETEAYNNIYEKIYDVPVEISIVNELGESTKYSYVTNESNSSYKLGALEPGAYTYTATAVINGKRESVIGGFTVVELQIETVNLTADFNLLRRLSKQSGGTFNLIDNPGNDLDQLQAQGFLFSEESLSPLYHLKWILFLLVGLVSIEWFSRKYAGGY